MDTMDTHMGWVPVAVSSLCDALAFTRRRRLVVVVVVVVVVVARASGPPKRQTRRRRRRVFVRAVEYLNTHALAREDVGVVAARGRCAGVVVRVGSIAMCVAAQFARTQSAREGGSHDAVVWDHRHRDPGRRHEPRGG